MITSPNADSLASVLRRQAGEAAQQHWLASKKEIGNDRRTALRNRIIEHAGIAFYPELPLLLKETKRMQLEGVAIASIRFQTLPDVFATASLYVPEGNGPFPGVLLTHGHWAGARNSDLFQEVAQRIARAGYVCLVPDAWGTGERSTVHGIAEYHGSNLGASLLNIGKTLLGMQVTENIRAVDLLCALPFVDRDSIGATGASGGGNQAMWLAAIDTRVKAVVPVVSVGTFRSYIMNSNCVCELLPGGLTFTEEADVLGLIAPRALRMINAKQEANPSFMPEEMLLSYRYAAPVFARLGAEGLIDYQVVEGTHGYNETMQTAMLAWFDRHLKQQTAGAVSLSPSAPVLFAATALATYGVGEREQSVMTTATYCEQEGRRILEELIRTPAIDPAEKRERLRRLLHLTEETIQQVIPQPGEAAWNYIHLKTTMENTLPVWCRPPRDPSAGYTVLLHGQGHAKVPDSYIAAAETEGKGIITADLWGTGLHGAAEATRIDGKLSAHHTLSRALMWLGRTMMGQWASEINLMIQWLRSQYPDAPIQLTGFREAGLAALYTVPFTDVPTTVTVVDTPVSYLFDTVEGVDHYNMSIHVPGILPWGDIGLLAALSRRPVTFRTPRTLSGYSLDARELRAHWGFFKTMQQLAGQQVDIRFE